VSDDAKAGAVLGPEQPVGVLGVGVEGRATIDYLLRHGVNDIAALDRQVVEGLPDGVQTAFGEGYDQGLDRFATVFRSPGIRPDHPELVRAAGAGTRVTSALSRFMELCPARAVVGVTGTVGKGTASSLTAAVLEAAGYTAHLGGNIGLSPLEFVDRVGGDHVVVLEISSFQAMDISTPPHVGVILKTTSEHLDWHRDVSEYRRAKANLVAGQRSDHVVVFNADSEGSIEIAGISEASRLAYSLSGPVDQGLFLRGDDFILRRGGRESRLPLDIRSVRLPGRFNLENVAAAMLAAIAVGVELDPACRAAESFTALPHRLELVAEHGGVRFVNDSYATRPEAALAALSAMDDAPLALILGGSEKHADFGELIAALAEKPNLVYVGLIGATAERIADEIGSARSVGYGYRVHDGLESAFEAAVRALPQQGVVLMSPACASFGLFKNYKVRGELFRALVADLIAERP
jgi:UDP-N-acetylmuramoylalanine--D-glutamate ligase